MDGVTIIQVINTLKDNLPGYILMSIILGIFLASISVALLGDVFQLSEKAMDLLFVIGAVVFSCVLFVLVSIDSTTKYYALIDEDVPLASVVEKYEIIETPKDSQCYYILKDKE